jgi:hypothetical protein
MVFEAIRSTFPGAWFRQDGDFHCHRRQGDETQSSGQEEILVKQMHELDAVLISSCSVPINMAN